MFYNNLIAHECNIEDIKIRPEQDSDFTVIHNIVRDAFAGAEHRDGDEQDLVARIRGCFLSELGGADAGDAFEHTGEVLRMLES